METLLRSGILNLVTKLPSSFKSGGEITIQAGSYAYSIDFYGPLDKHIAYRLRGSYESKKV
jgi:iron complex outermembrane receptor protein